MSSISTNSTQTTQNQKLEELEAQMIANKSFLTEGKFDEAIESYRICCEKAY